MALRYILRCIALIFIIGGKSLQAHTTKVKAQTDGKRTSGEKKANLLAADANHSAEPKDGHGHPCCFPVHTPPDVHELHVHIHERNQCKNGGVMTMGINGVFKCLCPPKYSGPLCEDTLFCYYNPCKNGGTCEELSKGFKCHCDKGFMGNTCQDRNFCKPNPCSHHATCVETMNSFKCICEEGYKGVQCKDVDPCFPNPCKNNGVCKDIQGSAKCDCPPSHKGPFCTETLVCFHNPCYHGGKCVENPTAPCVCEKGYIGTYCQDHVCNPSPCVNGGKCTIERSVGHHKWTYKCVCPRGFKGRLCHIPNPCLDFICLNGGTCIDEQTPQDVTVRDIVPHMLNFYCRCLPGFTGQKCESKICDKCDVNAECINNHCVCKQNYVGDGFHCSAIKDPCIPNPCKNKGVCVLGPDRSYICECEKGYCGAHCESYCTPCVSNPCKNNGTCTAYDNSYVCTCTPGFTGVNCELPLPNPCNSQPCAHGGTCSFDQIRNEYQCRCIGRYTGKNCEVCGCPKSRPLTNKVTLDAKCDAVGECYCPDYNGKETTYVERFGCVYSGTNPCFSNPCQNNGVCKFVQGARPDLHTYQCLCPDKYYGPNCECTECKCNKPCLNNGVCTDIATHVFECKCPAGFTGATCGEIVPTVGPGSCYSRPCLNGGTCVERALGSYDCICTLQYTGPHCDVDKCANCDVNADCINGRCRCRKGYIGTGYACVKDEKGKGCEDVLCPINHHCVQGFCICLPGLHC
ncbi:uncharacterized protein LOC144665586 isoform X1 [Oculina patagonica]